MVFAMQGPILALIPAKLLATMWPPSHATDLWHRSFCLAPWRIRLSKAHFGRADVSRWGQCIVGSYGYVMQTEGLFAHAKAAELRGGANTHTDVTHGAEDPSE